MTFAKIENTRGFKRCDPGETLIFSVTNKKVYHFGGQTENPLGTVFEDDSITLSFGRYDIYKPFTNVLYFKGSEEPGWYKGWKAYTGDGGDYLGFVVENDLYGINPITGKQQGGHLDL